MDQLGYLLEADLGLAARDDIGDRLAGWQPPYLSALAGDLIRDAELREQFGRQISAAAAVRIRDGLRRQKRAPECLDAADIRLGSPCSHHHADQRARTFDLA